jgi:hypothetical protein
MEDDLGLLVHICLYGLDVTSGFNELETPAIQNAGISPRQAMPVLLIVSVPTRSKGVLLFVVVAGMGMSNFCS